MEYVVFFSVVAVALIAVFIGGNIQRIRAERDFRASLLSGSYWKNKKNRISSERFLRLSGYHDKHEEIYDIDAITANDLNLSAVYHKINHTFSAAGEEYLFHRLLHIHTSKDELDVLEKNIQFFDANNETKVECQIALNKLGGTGKFSLYDYLDNLNNVTLKVRDDYLSILLFIPAICAFFVSIPAGIIALTVLSIVNIISYFNRKGSVEPYYISFAFILRLIFSSEDLYKIINKREGFSDDDFENIKKKISNCKKLSHGYSLINAQKISSGNPLDIFIEYFKMLFHLDIIVFLNMRNKLDGCLEDLDSIFEFVGYLDFCTSIVEFRRELNGEFCVPEFSDENNLTIEEGRHVLLDESVPNSISCDRSVLLTGSNASGKSTFLKMVALNALLAQSINTCVAKRYKAPMFNIFSSMSLRDDLESGDSYYMVEVKSLKRILDIQKESDRKTLVFVDEVLRGTNTIERISASTQILKSFAEHEGFCFAATHDIELTSLLENEYENYHFEEQFIEGDIYFNYKLQTGKATTRNAIKLLEMMGFDEKIVKNAYKLSDFVVENRFLY